MTNVRSNFSNVLRFCSAIALSASFYGPAQASTTIDNSERHLAADARVEDSIPKAEAVRYTCPMHPEVIADSPGRCPHCGMKLVEQEQGPKTGERS
jgi:hypothetical protein